MPINKAAWLPAIKTPHEIREAPYVPPGRGQAVIRNYAIAINPVDSAVQERGVLVQRWPAINGCDVAGVVEEVGEGVSHLKPGDRVLGSAVSVMGADAEGAFQYYTTCGADVVALIPNDMSYEEASVLPLGLVTAGSGLFLPNYCGLEPPSLQPKDQQSWVFIWGGASSMATVGIQLAINSGYHVITTASAKNFDYCKDLGAEKVFDYTDSTVVEQIVEFLQGKRLAGVLDSISSVSTIEKCIEVSKRSDSSRHVTTLQPVPEECQTTDVTLTFVFDPTMRGTELATRIFKDFLPTALKEKTIKPKPDPFVIGTGLESLQAGCDKIKAGVSAQKIVITLP